MDSIIRFCKLILLTALLVEAQNSSTDHSLAEPRRERTTGRILKLHAGNKPEPVNCSGEGFQADSKDCGMFYRCVKSENGNFTVFKFQCGPGTVYDPEIEVCNYPRSTKRIECGGLSNDMNEIDEVNEEFPSPIITKVPEYTERTTTQQNLENVQEDTHKNLITSSIYDNNELNKVTFPTSTTVTSSSHSLHQFSSSSTMQPSPTTTNQRASYSSNMTSIPNQEPNLQNNLCKSDGFMGDYENCHKFYRCVGNQNGGFTKYEFSCSEPTVWDDDIQGCNHPWAVKRRRCGKSGSNISSNKVLDILSQSTSSKYLHILDHDDSNKNQQQVQLNDISNVNQPQTTIEHQSEIQSQTQIYYGDRIYQLDKKPGKQNQTETKYESAVSQIQSQVINKNDMMQLQISHSNQLSEIPSTINDSTTKRISPTSFNNIKDKYSTDINVEYNNECTHSGFMGNSNNCKIFYRCVDNGKGGYIKHEFSCGEGTLWDQKLETCNHAWTVKNCGNEQYLQETEMAISTSTIKSTQTYATSIQTTENHVATLEETDQNDEDIGYNNHDQNSLTTTSSHVLATTISDSLQSTNNECKSSGFMGDTMNCKIFYRCVDDGKGGYTKHKFECEEGTIWDYHIEACNYAAAVKSCGRNVMMSTVKTSSKGTTILGNSITESSYVSTTLSLINTESSNNEFETSSDFHHDVISPPTIIVDQDIGTFNECKSAGFIGDKNNCKKFYRCVDNGDGSFKRYEFSCGQGTVWDQKIKGCNHVWAVEQCGGNNDLSDNEYLSSSENNGSLITTTAFTEYYHSTEDSTKFTKTDKPLISNGICKSEGFFGDFNNCKKFYRCVDDGKGNYNKYEFMCSDGTVWNEEITACDHESSNNKCVITSTEYPNYTTEHQLTLEGVYSSTNTIRQEEHNTQKITSSSNNSQCSSEGFHADPSDCKKFYRCLLNNAGMFTQYEFSCGEGTIWVQDMQSCDHNNGVIDCSLQNESTHKQPDDSQHSSTSIAIISVTSTSSQLPSKSNDTTEFTRNDCTSEGYHSDKKHCRKFYRCVDDGNGRLTKYDFTCGEGTAWDEGIKGCNHINLVKSCQSSTSTSEIVTNEVVYTSTVVTTLAQEPNSTDSNENSSLNCEDNCSEEGYFGNTNDCKKFYRCIDDGKDGFIKYDFTCGDGTIWDQNIIACNHPQDVVNPSCLESSTTDCSTSTNTTTLLTTTQSPTSTTQHGGPLSNTTQGETSKQPVNNNCTCNVAGYFPNPNDCKKFYRCVDWDGDGSRFSIFHFECGEGTIWDPELETCNHEESVYPPRDCSGTQSQTENSECGMSTTEATISQEITTQHATTSAPQTTMQTTTQQTTTSERTTTHQTTTKQPTTTHKTTTHESTTTIQTTSEQTTVSQQPTTTTSQTTTNNERPTISEETTTQQIVTTDRDTTSKEPTTTTTQIPSESTTIENTTTQKSTTEQHTKQTTDNQLTSTEQATTTENSTIDVSILTSTQSSSESSTNKGVQETTTENISSIQKCPEIDDDQYLFVCPTSFRRHPKYCNLFYQCTAEDDYHDAKIAVFTCPNNTIYDETKIKCVEEDKAGNSCDGEIASRRRVKRLGLRYKEPIVVTADSHSCTTTGYVPFENNSECSPAFLKCEKSKSGKLRGYVYQCPQNYIYWSVSRRCERKETVRDCKRTTNNWSNRWELPIEKHNVAW